MQVSDLFPVCADHACPQIGKHKHPLAHQLELIETSDRYTYLQGGYGCLGAETLIGGVPVAEFVGGPVLTLFGQSFASASSAYAERASLYRVSTRSRKQVSVTLDHRFLTPTGWQRLRDLHVGDFVATHESLHDVAARGVLAYFRADYLDNSHQDDELLSPAQVASQDRWQQSHMLDGDDTMPLFSVPLSRNSWLTLDGHPVCAVEPRNSEGSDGLLPLIDGDAFRSLDIGALPGKVGQWLPWEFFATRVFEPDSATIQTLPYPPYYQGWDAIARITYLRDGQYYDLSVPGPAHYAAQGLWHHNSAKTLGLCAMGLLLTLKVPGNRGIIIRETYPKLHDNTQRVFMEMVERVGVKWHGRENRDGWYHRVIFSNKSEVHFREGRTVRLGADYGWFGVDEASEVEERLFKNLQARLRLPAAGKFLRGVLLSNPPHQNHWLHKVFGEEPGAFTREVETAPGKFEQTTFRYMQISTRANPHNPPGYLADLLTGLTQAEIARLVEGGYGYIPDGPPVYPTFEHHRHVGVPDFQPRYGIVRGWDFGFRHPAVTFHQFWRCHKAEIHWTVLDAMDDRMVEVVPLAQRVMDYTRLAYPKLDPLMIEDCGDIAGTHRGDVGPAPITLLADAPFHLSVNCKVCSVEDGLRMIREFLRLPQCECGQSRFLVHRKARYVIEALQGGYHLRRDQAGKAMKEDPMKDGFYDDFMDSLRYAAEHYLRSELIDPKLLETLDRTDPRRMYKGRDRDPWRAAVRKMMARGA